MNISPEKLGHGERKSEFKQYEFTDTPRQQEHTENSNNNIKKAIFFPVCRVECGH